MYVEFGATSTDTVGLTFTYGSTSTGKTFNVLARQIACTSTWAAPTDCTQGSPVTLLIPMEKIGIIVNLLVAQQLYMT